jgi:5-methylcytosine-specific restriction enzyme A
VKRSPIARGSSELKRTPLERKTWLQASTGRLRQAATPRREPKPKPAPRNTDPTAAVKRTVKARAGMCCERCGVSVAAYGFVIHHRRPRAMGGTTRPDTNLPPNLLLLCAPCHGEVESSRQISFDQGWLVRAEHDPAVCPVWIAGRGRVLLRADGSTTPYREAA